MFRYTGQVVKEVLLGIALWGIIGMAVCLIVWGMADGIFTGFLLGTIMAAAYFFHMSVTLETSVDLMEEKSAKNHAMKAWIIRIAAGAAILIFAWLSGWFDMMAILIGLFTLKLGVYTRPIIHKAFCRNGDHKDSGAEA